LDVSALAAPAFWALLLLDPDRSFLAPACGAAMSAAAQRAKNMVPFALRTHALILLQRAQPLSDEVDIK